jgi:hypothetical protein
MYCFKSQNMLHAVAADKKIYHSPEAEFMNVQFRWGFWAWSWEFLDSRFRFRKQFLHYKPVSNRFCSNPLVDVTVNSKYDNSFVPVTSKNSASVHKLHTLDSVIHVQKQQISSVLSCHSVVWKIRPENSYTICDRLPTWKQNLNVMKYAFCNQIFFFQVTLYEAQEASCSLYCSTWMHIFKMSSLKCLIKVVQ